MRRVRAAMAATAVAVAAAVSLAACGSSSSPASSSGGTSAGSPATEVRLGYFPNVTHATPIVADQEGLYTKELGSATLSVKTFNAGPAAMEALKSGAIDATYVGPGPATNAFSNSDGQALTVVSGAATGGTAFVVDSTVNSAADLKGKKVASPQLGNTQDVALRYWLLQQGLKTDLQGGGDVNIAPQDNAQIVDAFAQHLIAGAWVPEPYATRLVAAGGHVLVDEHSLWPDGKFPITILAVRSDFLSQHPDTVKALLKGQLAAQSLIASDPAKAQADVGAVIEKVSGKPVKASEIAAAWKNLEFTNDPVPSAITEGANHAVAVGVLKKQPDLTGMVDLTTLNSLLAANGKPTVTP
ncbi:MAG: ABC transporter substrate-binding protein [Dermatophilaceae bacterium]